MRLGYLFLFFFISSLFYIPCFRAHPFSRLVVVSIIAPPRIVYVESSSDILPSPWGWFTRSGDNVVRRVLAVFLKPKGNFFCFIPFDTFSNRPRPCVTNSNASPQPIHEPVDYKNRPKVFNSIRNTDDDPQTGFSLSRWTKKIEKLVFSLWWSSSPTECVNSHQKEFSEAETTIHINIVRGCFTDRTRKLKLNGIVVLVVIASDLFSFSRVVGKSCKKSYTRAHTPSFHYFRRGMKIITGR